MDTRTIFFIGKPGCGKDTQAELLSQTTGWPVTSAGDLFRALAQENTILGRKVKSEMNAGALAPDWLAMHLYLQSLFNLPENAGIIFDGFSREVSQANLILRSLAWLERPFMVIHIQVSDESVRARLFKRGKSSGRADDKVVDERLKEYYAHTEPALSIFKDAGKLIEVDGEPAPEVIAQSVKSALGVS